MYGSQAQVWTEGAPDKLLEEQLQKKFLVEPLARGKEGLYTDNNTNSDCVGLVVGKGERVGDCVEIIAPMNLCTGYALIAALEENGVERIFQVTVVRSGDSTILFLQFAQLCVFVVCFVPQYVLILTWRCISLSTATAISRTGEF